MRALFISEGPNGCGLYRAEIPLRYLHLHGIEARLSHVNALPAELDWADVIVVQKQFEREFYNKMVALQRKGKRIIYELDDDVFNLPAWNPAHNFYNRVRSNIGLYLNMADAVTVSTPHLRSVVLKYNKNVHVLPNSIDFGELDAQGPAPEMISALDKRCQPITLTEYRQRTEGKVVIGWLGSPTHKHDLQLILHPLKVLTKRYPEQVVVVMGGCADKGLVQALDHKQLLLLEMVPPRVYMRYLAALGFTIGLAPVCDHPFNYSKSNLKVIEYMAAGFVPVASNLVTYNSTIKPGENGMLCSTPSEWIQRLTDLIDSPPLRSTLVRKGGSYVRQHFSAEANAAKWAQAYNSL